MQIWLSSVGHFFSSFSQINNDQNIFFIADYISPLFTSKLFDSAILLDRIQDPGNLGSILRTAAAFGIKKVFCSKLSAFAWSPKTLRSGSGAHFLLDIYENMNLVELIQSTSLPIYSTSPHAKINLYNHQFPKLCIWLFGNEGNGVSNELLKMSTQTLSIPHISNLESINVAASVAVCLYEKYKQSIILNK